MFVDARLLPTEQVIETEVCIIGSGPAGIAIAREFIGHQTRVCILESGGLDCDSQAQLLSEAITVGDPFLSPQITRNRQFGGNSNVWAIKIGDGQIGVRYAPLDDIDFEQRDWLPYSGWAFPKSHLASFYERAQAVCHAGPFDYSAERWEGDRAPRLPLDPQKIDTSIFQFGPRNAFTHIYREELGQADNITVYYNATVVELEANDSSQAVTHAQVACLPGGRFRVAAKVFVLAKGGLENARLLLLSNKQQSSGLGNQHDLVGRFFMDHPLVDGGMFIPSDPDLFNKTAFYDLRRVNGTAILGKLTPAPALLRSEKLLNSAVLMFPRPSLRQFDAIVAFKTMAEQLVDKQLPDQFFQRLVQVTKGLDYVALASFLAATKKQSLLHGFGRGGWSELPNNQKRFKAFQLFYQTEQAPDPANRLVLSSERDSLGCQKLELNWYWGQVNRESVRRTHKILAEEIARASLGRLETPPNELEAGYPAGVAHHMGTTRMHVDPKQGVVDENCRVHGISNLYIAGSSVFPTGGYANPTLTIVALSLRLADHVKNSLIRELVIS